MAVSDMLSEELSYPQGAFWVPGNREKLGPGGYTGQHMVKANLKILAFRIATFRSNTSERPTSNRVRGPSPPPSAMERLHSSDNLSFLVEKDPARTWAGVPRRVLGGVSWPHCGAKPAILLVASRGGAMTGAYFRRGQAHGAVATMAFQSS